MSILAKAKQLNNGYFNLAYAILGKPPAGGKAAKILFKKADNGTQPDGTQPNDVKNDNGYKAFTTEDKPRFKYSTCVLLGLISTNNLIFHKAAKLSYRTISEKIGHSSKTTAANLEEAKNVLSKTNSEYEITVAYDGKPFILCYEFLFNEELQLAEGQTPVRLSDLEAIFVSLIINNKLNPNRNEDFVATVNYVANALHIPHSTAQSLIDRLIAKGVCRSHRLYIDKNGNTVIEDDAKAKTKNEKTTLTVCSQIIRRCNVIYKEYKKRAKEKKEQAEQRDVSKRKNGKQTKATQNLPNPLTEQEKFDKIEAKFIRDKKYLNLTNKYKALKEQGLHNYLSDHDEAKFDMAEAQAETTLTELYSFLYENGIDDEHIPEAFARLIIQNLEA